MAGSYNGFLAKAVAKAKEAAGEAIDTTADNIITTAISTAKTVIYGAYKPHAYRRRKSFMDEGQYFYDRQGLEGYVAPRQIPNSEGFPPPTVDKDLPVLIEMGVSENTYEMNIGRYVLDQDWSGPELGFWIDFSYGSQYYDYYSIGPRPWWSETLNQERSKQTLVINCIDALERRGFIVEY